MKNREKPAKEILLRYVEGKASAEEIEWVEKYYEEVSNKKDILIDTELADKHFSNIWSEIDKEINPRKSNIIFKAIAAAVALLILSFIPIYFYYKKDNNTRLHLAENQNFVPSFYNQTVLSINGTNKVTLDDLQLGSEIVETGAVISKGKDGTIIFTSPDQTRDELSETFHTVSTPRAKQHRIKLPDNSIVWLNANSSIEFPVPFSTNLRQITLIGEAFFEVERDLDRPFVVLSQGQQILVKGTKFNVSAYPKEKLSVTTLLEGAVDLNIVDKDNKILRKSSLEPNDQVIVSGVTLEKQHVNSLDYIDWTNEKFNFNDTPLKDVMTKIARWYDVEVVWEENLKNITFSGSVSKFDDIRDVLRKMSHTESVHFEISERRVMVKK